MMREPRRGRGAVRGPQTRPPRSDETSGKFLPALPPFLPSRPLCLRSHGLRVRLLSTRRGPVQSENLSSGTSGDRNRLREDGIYHDVNTLPALTDYHERPRRASATRRVTAGGRTGLFAESQSSVGNVGGRLFAAGRGSYDKAGYVGVGWPVYPVRSWRPFGSTPRHPMSTPPAAHQLGRADKHETVSREGSGITFL